MNIAGMPVNLTNNNQKAVFFMLHTERAHCPEETTGIKVSCS
jgi:hypothetical protein